jgi:hypothetical protein
VVPDLISDFLPALFEGLPQTITVMPTENYYYFQLIASGQHFRGSLNFYAERLADGVVGLNIEELGPSDGYQQYRELTSKDGLNLLKVGSLRYSLTYAGITKIVQFNPSPLQRPTIVLPQGHQALAKTFDESGLPFILAFDAKRRHLYWVLDEEVSLAADFTELPGNLFVSQRTGFVFFEGLAPRRKVLIGVQRAEVKKNGWCDGPFDQLPDMAISEGLLDLSNYILKEFPQYIGRIDRYGIFLADRSERVALDAYRMYDDVQAFSEFVRRIKASYQHENERVYQLTQSRLWLRP